MLRNMLWEIEYMHHLTGRMDIPPPTQITGDEHGFILSWTVWKDEPQKKL
jgi:hypothetical protein